MPPQTTVSAAEGETVIRAILRLAVGMVETRGCDQGTLTLSTKTVNTLSGGAWEISAEAPGPPSKKTQEEGIC